jgi:hypothetical protein
MSVPVAEASARVVISQNGTIAEVLLRAPEGDAPCDVPVELCFGIAAEAGVRIAPDAMAALKEACKGVPPGQERRVEIARGKPPTHALHGSVNWNRPATAEAGSSTEQAEGDAAASTDHYQRTAYQMVKAGDVLGVLVPPTAGEDGVDVTGRTLAARTGKPVRLRLDDSILADAKGNLIAQRDGVLTITKDRATVGELLEIDGFVDFSTGHVDFAGEVCVHKGVRDLFRVTAAGGITVHGLVESSTLESGASIVARGGMAGRGKGQLLCKGDLDARYISGYFCMIGGSLRFDREIIDSTIEVGGSVASANGSVIGGCLTAVGSVQVGTLGGSSGSQTRVVVGSVPSLEPRLNKLEMLIAELTERQRKGQDELRQLTRPGRRLGGSEKERTTELTFQMQTDLCALGKAEAARERLRQVIDGLSTIDVTVASEVHPGVVFRCGTREFRVRDRLKGPIRITRNPRGPAGDLLIRRGDSSPPERLAQHCDVRAAT